MWSEPEAGGEGDRKLRRRQSGFPFRDKQRDFPGQSARVRTRTVSEDLPLEEGRCLACRRRARKREEDAMTLREMSVEYRPRPRRSGDGCRSWRRRGNRRRTRRSGPIWREESGRWRSSGGRPGIRRFCWSVTMKGGTTAMKSIRYRRGWENERDLAVYTRLMAEDNGAAPAAAPESGPGASGGGDGAPEAGPVFIL